MIAQTLALALVVSSPGPARTRPAAVLQPDNLVRARHGLLPRKVVRARARPRARGRLVVLLPPAPTWLGAPAEPAADAPTTGPAVDAAVAPIAGSVEPAAAVARAEAPPGLSGSVEGVAVRWMLVRHRAAWEPEAAVRATIAGSELEAVLVRRP